MYIIALESQMLWKNCNNESLQQIAVRIKNFMLSAAKMEFEYLVNQRADIKTIQSVTPLYKTVLWTEDDGNAISFHSIGIQVQEERIKFSKYVFFSKNISSVTNILIVLSLLVPMKTAMLSKLLP